MKISLAKNLSLGIPMEYIREVKFFKELEPMNHPNILKLYDFFVSDQRVHIILEQCNKDLMSLISKKDVPLSIADIKAILFDILSPLQLCHSRYIAHRDIKPENYLIGKDKRLRLSDFGLSRYLGTPRTRYTTEVQTIMYRAPEVLMKSRLYSTIVDVWSVGCIVGALILRAPLFLGNNDTEVLYNIYYILGTPTTNDWPDIETLPGYIEFDRKFDRKKPSSIFPDTPDDLLDLLYKMLEYNPENRITVEQALKHPFFTNNPPMTSFDDLPYWK